MLLALCATTIVVIALLWEVAMPRLEELIARRRARRCLVVIEGYDPGRERRAEQRARTLLKSCVNEDDWQMYQDLGFLRVWGTLADGPEGNRRADSAGGAPYAYLIYPHKPILAFLPQTNTLLSEYCVE